MNNKKPKKSKVYIINLAILSPNENAYSETFIQAHKSLPFNISFYYDGLTPTQLEGHGYLSRKKKLAKLFYYLKSKINQKSLALIFLKKSLQKQKINFVLAEYGPTAVENLTILKELKLPLYVYFHGYDISVKSILNNYERGYKDVFNYAVKIFSVSSVMTQKLIHLGCPPEKIVYNVYGPNPIFFKLNPQFEKKQFAAIGRFVDKKAPYYTILAFKLLTEKYPDAKLSIAGDGPLLNTCKNLINYLNLQDNIELLGVINPNKWAQVLENSIGFIQHSITAENGDMEGTPVAILEACAAGIPIISTYHAGIPDIIEHEKEGLLCKEHDVKQMSDNLFRFCEDITFVKELGKNARQKIKDNFSLQSHLNKITEQIKLF